jgi:capsular exopolysaccharide synthesis family protein
MIMGGIYLLIAPRSYRSSAEVYTDPVQGGGEDYQSRQCELMTSAPVLAIALAQDGITGLETLRGVSDPIEYLQHNISAEIGKPSQFIEVSFESRDARESAIMVNAVVQAYVTFERKVRNDDSIELVTQLQKQKAQDESAISGADAQLALLRADIGPSAEDGSANNPIVQQEQALSDALTAARMDADNAKAAYDQALGIISSNPDLVREAAAPDDAGDMLAASPAQLDVVRGEIVQLVQSLKDLQETYLPNHPTVIQEQSRLNELTVTYLRAEHQRWQSAKYQEDALQASFDQQHKLVLQQAAKVAEYDRLKAVVARNERDEDTVEMKIGQVNVNRDAASPNISITRPAVPVFKASHPVKSSVFFGWTLLGLVLGCGLAIADDKLAGRSQVSRIAEDFGSPIVGVLPGVSAPGATLAMIATQTRLESTGPMAEATRAIARTLTKMGLGDERGRTLLVASMGALDGRTTLATNLALAMAQGGMRVLLVDANNRSPRLHQIFNLDNSFGLFDALSKKSDGQSATQKTSIEKLDVLPCGNLPLSAVERLNSESLVDLFGELSDRYDRVIIDSPALGRGVEARILAANCSAAILVTAARLNSRRQIEYGLRLLRSVGANVLGLVINEPGAVDPLSPASSDLPPALWTPGQTQSYPSILTAGDEQKA